MPNDISILACDDWIAVYKDGKQVFAGHSCEINEGLKALDIPFDFEYDDRDPGEYDIEFPEELN